MCGGGRYPKETQNLSGSETLSPLPRWAASRVSTLHLDGFKLVIFTWQVTLITCFLRLKTNYSFLCFVRICSFFWVNTNSMFADLYIFYCGACDYSLSLFLRGGWVCGRGRGYQTPCLSVKEHKSLYVDRWICIQVCQGFDKETLLGHNRSVPKTTIKLLAAPNLSRELFLPGLFIVEVMFVQRSRVSVMSSDFILLILWDLICHKPHRPAPPSSPHGVCTVCTSIYKHTCTCQVCFKASSIQSAWKGGAFLWKQTQAYSSVQVWIHSLYNGGLWTVPPMYCSRFLF